jgi:hypothetical protein
MSRRLFLACSLILPLVLVTGAQAQSKKKIDTVIFGTVFGADGKAVPAAAVNCQSSAGIHPRIVHTDAKGHYRITGLKQDWYDLRASSNGAYSDWEKNLLIHQGESKEITLRLLNGNTALSGVLPSKQKK